MNYKFVSNSNYVLRKVLNSKDSLDILKNFIEAMLNIKITEIELNPYLEKKKMYLPKEERFGIADVRIKTDDLEELNVGIQFVDGIYIKTKMLMYYSQIHLNQQEHDIKREFTKTVTINLLDYNYFSSDDYYRVLVVNSNNGGLINREIQMIVVELQKFYITDYNNLTNVEQWISYLVGNDEEVLEKILENNEHIKKLDNLLYKYWSEEKME